MPLVAIVVLALILTFPRPPYLILSGAAVTIPLAATAILIPAVAAWWFNLRAIRLLDAMPADPGPAQRYFGKRLHRVTLLLGFFQVFLLLCTSWLPLMQRLPIVGGWPVAPAVLATMPLVLGALLIWVAVYPIERALRQLALEVQLFRGKPIHPVWPLPAYLMFNLRHHLLFVYAPLVPILAARDLIDFYEKPLLGIHAFLPDLLLGAAVLLIALLAPVLLRFVWVTQRLPEGPLRDRLIDIGRRLRLRFNEILVWRTDGMMVNAAVMGVVPSLRYVMITDGMLEQLDDVKIEAVFGHEAGHVKRHHIFFFLLLSLITGCMLAIVSVRLRGVDTLTFQLATGAIGVVLLAKWGLLFGWISRRFERQADLFGVRTLALAGVPCGRECPLHDSVLAPSPETSRAPLCRTAAHIFGDTLNDVALLNGIPPEAPSWRHSSIASRSRFVQQLAGDPDEARRFERLVQRIQWSILACAAFFGAWAAWELKLIDLIVRVFDFS